MGKIKTFSGKVHLLDDSFAKESACSLWNRALCGVIFDKGYSRIVGDEIDITCKKCAKIAKKEQSHDEQ